MASSKLVTFLTEQYGNRIEHPYPLIATDPDTLRLQLDLVGQQLRSTRRLSMIWFALGLGFSLLNLTTLISEPFDLAKAVMVLLGVVLTVIGFMMQRQVSVLVKKKTILETLLFLHENEEEATFR